MATTILTDCKVYVGGYDLSTAHNKLGLDYAAEAVDDTSFGMAARSSKGGLKTVKVVNEGWADYGAVLADELLFAEVGQVDRVMSIAPLVGADAEAAYFFKAAQLAYKPGAQVGALMKFTFDAAGRGDGLIRGTILHPATTARAASGNGVARQLGAVVVGKKLYAALHVLQVANPADTLVVKVQSDDAVGFPSSADRIAFASASAVGAQYSSIAGPITDDWFRINYTITGGAPSFKFIVTVGIL